VLNHYEVADLRLYLSDWLIFSHNASLLASMLATVAIRMNMRVSPPTINHHLPLLI
jgi:hypothetical protein